MTDEEIINAVAIYEGRNAISRRWTIVHAALRAVGAEDAQGGIALPPRVSTPSSRRRAC